VVRVHLRCGEEEEFEVEVEVEVEEEEEGETAATGVRVCRRRSSKGVMVSACLNSCVTNFKGQRLYPGERTPTLYVPYVCTRIFISVKD
jgi:hypothetical protein